MRGGAYRDKGVSHSKWGHAWWQSQEELCSEAQERYLAWGGGGGET